MGDRPTAGTRLVATRRQWLQRAAAGVGSAMVSGQAAMAYNQAATANSPQARAAVRATGATALTFNEDNSHWFYTRAGQKPTEALLASFIDQYAGTQIREFLLSANSQRTSFASKVWDPIWLGYEPDGPDDQALLRSTPEAARAGARKWIHTAWACHHAGLDPYRIWIGHLRAKGISPWISMRMNDLHNVDDPDSYMHSTFWRKHPEYRRVPWRAVDWRDRAFDFSHAAVRDYHFQLLEEYCERYDFDGLELDWMRFGFHFQPGREEADAHHLDDFVRRTRQLLDGWQRRRRHPIALGVRVPSRPATALRMGMDGAEWARQGWVQMLTVTPFWASVETDMPIRLWRQLAGPKVRLSAGLELLVRPYHAYRPLQYNNLEMVRGAAAHYLEQGADRIYLFNYMDSQTAMVDLQENARLLRECGQWGTLQDLPRRHVVTYSDTAAPGEANGAQLPKALGAGDWGALRIATASGQSGELRLAVVAEGGPGGGGPGEGEAASQMAASQMTVRVNGVVATYLGFLPEVKPGPAEGLHRWQLPVARRRARWWWTCNQRELSRFLGPRLPVEVKPGKVASVCWSGGMNWPCRNRYTEQKRNLPNRTYSCPLLFRLTP